LQLRGSHMDSLPYVSNNHHVPSTPKTTPLTPPWPSHLLFPPAPSPRDHSPRPPTTRISTTAGNCFPSRTARSLALIHRVPVSAYRVYVSASRMHRHRRVVCMWVAARRTRCLLKVRAEREGGSRCERAASSSGHTDTLRVHKEAYVLPRAAPGFLARPCRKRGRTPRPDAAASLRAARHSARVKGRARCIYTAQQLTRAAHQP
jgi:hypothetical protein